MDTTLRFSRSEDVKAFGRSVRASTDAHALLWVWVHELEGRDYEVIEDTDAQSGEPDYLVARLSDPHASAEMLLRMLGPLCDRFALSCEPEHSRVKREWEDAWEAYKLSDAALNNAFGALAESRGNKSQIDRLLEQVMAAELARSSAWQAFLAASRR